MSAAWPGDSNQPNAKEGSGAPKGPLAVLKYDKPWGEFERYAHNEECTVKIITVAPGGVLSKQYHRHRDELWVVLDPGAHVELGDEALEPEPGEKLIVPRWTVHRLSCVGEGAVRVLEVSFGEFDENDIVRLEDAYGRTGSAGGPRVSSEVGLVTYGCKVSLEAEGD